MARFGVTRDDLAAGRRSGAFIALMDFEAGRAESFYRAAVAPAGDRRALTAATIMRAIYSRLLAAMRSDGFRVFDRRYSLSRARKLWLVLRGWLGWL
jgi:phytoene synthase